MFSGPPQNSAGMFNKNNPSSLQNPHSISGFSLETNQTSMNQSGLFPNNTTQNSGTMIGSSIGQGNAFMNKGAQNNMNYQQ
jgi:hypothetical protein